MCAKPGQLFRPPVAFLTSLLFVACICIPPMASVFKISPPVPLQESDTNVMPAFHLDFDTLSQIIYKIRRNWLERNFGLRKVMVRWECFLDVVMLKSSTPFDSVLAGKGDWLYLSQENPKLNVIQDYRGVQPLTQEQLDIWCAVFQKRQAWLAERGIRYLIVVAPNKASIYPEYIPRKFNKVHQRNKLDHMLDTLRAGGLDVLDLRPAELEAKKHRLCYYRTDSHWNPYGAFYGYRAIAEHLQAAFPQIKPAEESSFDIHETPGLLGGLSYMIALGDYYKENMVIFTPKTPRLAKPVEGGEVALNHFQPLAVFETPDPSKPRALIIRDSFSHEVIPFLSEHFSRSVYAWPFPTDAVKVRPFGKDMIEREKPDIVIDEFVERYFTQPPPPSALEDDQ